MTPLDNEPAAAAGGALARAVLSVVPLLEALGDRDPLPVPAPPPARETAAAVTRRLAVTGLAFVPEDEPAPATGGDTEVFVRIVAARLRPALAALAAAVTG
ncbi:hypothetical protein ACFUAC_09715, partial [Streptomyces sp. NPDC057148]|uniref:hypothetical protein n=1 Tax=Streptomyces sp. NPDC057148 TaxID=3346035 RepID=UPI00364243C7